MMVAPRPARMVERGGGVTCSRPFLSLVCACARNSSCPFCVVGLGWLEPAAYLGFVAG
eukprot:COSAG02_NODE_59948_length_272_cov_1.531792_1_plen_57_part_01